MPETAPAAAPTAAPFAPATLPIAAPCAMLDSVVPNIVPALSPNADEITLVAPSDKEFPIIWAMPAPAREDKILFPVSSEPLEPMTFFKLPARLSALLMASDMDLISLAVDLASSETSFKFRLAFSYLSLATCAAILFDSSPVLLNSFCASCMAFLRLSVSDFSLDCALSSVSSFLYIPSRSFVNDLLADCILVTASEYLSLTLTAMLISRPMLSPFTRRVLFHKTL